MLSDDDIRQMVGLAEASIDERASGVPEAGWHRAQFARACADENKIAAILRDLLRLRALERAAVALVDGAPVMGRIEAHDVRCRLVLSDPGPRSDRRCECGLWDRLAAFEAARRAGT